MEPHWLQTHIDPCHALCTASQAKQRQVQLSLGSDCSPWIGFFVEVGHHQKGSQSHVKQHRIGHSLHLQKRLRCQLTNVKAKQAELSAKESAAFLPDHHCTRGRSPQGKRNDSGPYMHRMMRSEPSCGKTKLHGQKDKVHDLKGMACTKLSTINIIY